MKINNKNKININQIIIHLKSNMYLKIESLQSIKEEIQVTS